MEKIGWTEANKENDPYDMNNDEHKARLFARIYKWYRDSNENGVDEKDIQQEGEKIKEAIFWKSGTTAGEGFLKKMRDNRENILKEGYTLQDIAYTEPNSFTTINIGEHKKSIRNVPPMSWPPEINPLYIKIGDTYALLELNNVDGTGIRYHGHKVILDPNNTTKSSGFGDSKYKYRYKKTGHQTEEARKMGKKSTNKVARGKPCEKGKMMGYSMCEPGYQCDDLHVTHGRSENGPFLPVCFSKTLMKGGRRRRKSRRSRRRKSRRKSKKRKSRRRGIFLRRRR